MSRKIPLTQGLFALVDDVDYERVSKFKWYAHVNKRSTYAHRNEYREGAHKTVCLHRFVAGLEHGDPQLVDHRDTNGLNNTRSNLRVCMDTHNSKNQRKRVNNTSGFKGVCFKKSMGKWCARISVNYLRVHLGYFDTVELAYDAYKTAAIKHHGEFARVS